LALIAARLLRLCRSALDSAERLLAAALAQKNASGRLNENLTAPSSCRRKK